jgi:hypothetical protein
MEREQDEIASVFRKSEEKSKEKERICVDILNGMSKQHVYKNVQFFKL